MAGFQTQSGMIVTCKGLKIIGSGAGLPSTNVTNQSLWPQTSEWVEETLGIFERRILSPNETLLDLCVNAARQALDQAGILGSDIDVIIVATSTPDYINPSMASLLHAEIEGKVNCMSLDVQAVCAGFIHGLALISALISAKSGKYFLIIGADQFSKITDFSTRDCVFFGDAAAAMIIESTNQSNQFALEVFTEGSGWKNFYTSKESGKFIMNSKEVSRNASSKLPHSIKSICEFLNIEPKDISHFFTHQPSKGVLDKLNASLDIPSNKAFRNVKNRGNTAAATIPLVFHESNYLGYADNGDFICFSAIGAGWVWGSAILEWSE